MGSFFVAFFAIGNVNFRRLSFIDFGVIIFGVVVFTNTIVNNAFNVQSFILRFSFLIVYFTLKNCIDLRQVFTAESVYFVVLLLTSYQGFVGVLQLFNYLPTNVEGFPTGMFINPGTYGVFIASLAAFCISIYFYVENNLFRYWGLVTFVIATTIVFFSESRAAELSLFISLSALIVIKKNQMLRSLSNTNKMVFAIAFIVLNFLLIYLLFILKKDSAYGRILIWATSFNMGLSHPIFGVGTDLFAGKYIAYQGDYLSKLESSSLNRFAGDVRYAFNFLLQFFCEGGLIYLTIIIIIAILVVINLQNELNKSQSNISKPLLICTALSATSLVIGSLFSYSLSITTIQVWGIVLFFILSNDFNGKGQYIVIGKHIKIFISVVLLVLSVFLFNYIYDRYNSFKYWGQIENLYLNDTQKITALNNLSKQYPHFRYYPGYLIELANLYSTTNNYINSIKLYNKAKVYSPNIAIYLGLGHCYLMLNQYHDAEKSYKTLDNAIPNMITPKYMLFKLYRSNNEKNKWEDIAKRIIAFKPKIETFYTDSIKREMILHLKNND